MWRWNYYGYYNLKLHYKYMLFIKVPSGWVAKVVISSRCEGHQWVPWRASVWILKFLFLVHIKARTKECHVKPDWLYACLLHLHMYVASHSKMVKDKLGWLLCKTRSIYTSLRNGWNPYQQSLANWPFPNLALYIFLVLLLLFFSVFVLFCLNLFCVVFVFHPLIMEIEVMLR